MPTLFNLDQFYMFYWLLQLNTLTYVHALNALTFNALNSLVFIFFYNKHVLIKPLLCISSQYPESGMPKCVQKSKRRRMEQEEEKQEEEEPEKKNWKNRNKGKKKDGSLILKIQKKQEGKRNRRKRRKRSTKSRSKRKKGNRILRIPNHL